MTPELYPPAPAEIPADLATPSSRYRRQAALAVIGVALFFLFYFGLTGWLGLVAWRAFRDFAAHPGRSVAIGVPASFLALVLLKGLFARKKMSRDALLEITAEEQPEFVAFVHAVADEVGAKRPAHIYLSPDVNAAVFLDVGLINLLIPSRKNLIVGLGLVNALSLDELKAVVAHEFGHFAQRSMGIGQWVYIAQGFVSDLLARRDFLDRIIHFLSRIDLRVAWIGWIMRLLVWALRAIVDHFFRFVLLLGRALSRQMEFQADLVAVRVSGSDSLVHALHRLGAADRAWGEAASFVVNASRRGKRVCDLFAIQERFVERYREVHALEDHGVTPKLPEGADRGAHRVFAHSVADAPRMWSTHPSNQDREKNCKARYFPSALDPRPAWSVFRDPDTLRARLTAHFLDLATREEKAPRAEVEQVDEPLEESLARVDEIFGRSALDRRYQGLYTTMPFTRALKAGEPVAVEPAGELDREALASRFEALFDPALADQVEQFFQLDEELAKLEGLQKGFLEAPGGVIRHRGRQLGRKELGEAVEEVRAEHEAERRALVERFQRARGVALRVARGLDTQYGSRGTTWEAHLRGLHALLRYAEHTAAEVTDVVTHFEHVLAIVFADGNVSSSEMKRLKAEGARVAETLRKVFDDRRLVFLPDPVRRRLTKDGVSWEEIVGPELHLAPPTEADFANDWIGIAASWWSPYIGSLNALATATLDVLIETEEVLLNRLASGTEPGEAPVAGEAPPHYPSCGFGEELPRQERLGWWDRFQVAEGWLGGAMRFTVAAALLAPAFWFGASTGDTSLWIYNGLETPVVVRVGEEVVSVPARMETEVDVPSEPVTLSTTTRSGRPVESFTTPDLAGLDDPVYNVAGAAVFLRWWASYGPAVERPAEVLAGRFFEGRAEYAFRQPPESIRSRSGSSLRSVLEPLRSPMDTMAALQRLDPVESEAVVEAHLEHDPVDAPGWVLWMHALPDDERRARFEQAYAEAPSARLLNALQRARTPAEREAFCAEATSRPEPSGVALIEALSCAPDARTLEVAAQSGDPWVGLLAVDWEERQHRFGPALQRLNRLSMLREHPDAAYVLRQARLLRLLGRADEANRLASDRGFYDLLRGIETQDPEYADVGAFAWARELHTLDAGLLARAQQLEVADELAFGAASVGAPPAWLEALRATRAPFDDEVAALAAWALAVREGDAALRERAASAYRALGGELPLERFELEAVRAEPAAWLGDERSRSLTEQAHARLVGVVALGADAPAEWRDFAEAALFSYRRPALR
ncbi:MAG TPA: M48 family metallopeptidase [Polyangiaceae bacterium LLY-WYZ-15_(1-7)]|nr:M48 family metallopeptidase [Polyangiaceae bacterium LLY-WYZ-15_(1-7)]